MANSVYSKVIKSYLISDREGNVATSLNRDALTSLTAINYV